MQAATGSGAAPAPVERAAPEGGTVRAPLARKLRRAGAGARAGSPACTSQARRSGVSSAASAVVLVAGGAGLRAAARRRRKGRSLVLSLLLAHLPTFPRGDPAVTFKVACEVAPQASARAVQPRLDCAHVGPRPRPHSASESSSYSTSTMTSRCNSGRAVTAFCTSSDSSASSRRAERAPRALGRGLVFEVFDGDSPACRRKCLAERLRTAA